MDEHSFCIINFKNDVKNVMFMGVKSGLGGKFSDRPVYFRAVTLGSSVALRVAHTVDQLIGCKYSLSCDPVYAWLFHAF